MRNNKVFKLAATLTMAGVLAMPLSSCTSSGDDPQNVVVGVPIVYTKRHVSAVGDPLDPVTFAEGGDLMYKDLSSPSAEAINVTSVYTQGEGDVSDPEVDFEAKRILFSMKGPDDTTWNLWEWYMDSADVPSTRAHTVEANGFGVLARVINDDSIANQGDDIDPYYLDDTKIVFASTRQKISSQEVGKHRDEYERRQSTLLHTIDSSSTSNIEGTTDDSFIDQISFNQSHDRDPIVDPKSGEIVFSRWDHLGPKNHFPLFKVNPNGTGMFVKYGAFSSGNSRLHPRYIPNGPDKGKVIASLMPLQGSNEGGALVVMDVERFSEQGQPAQEGIEGSGQELPEPFQTISFNMRNDEAEEGETVIRLSTPYPLRDGTNRVLIAFSRDLLVERQNRLGEMEIQSIPRYGIQLYDMDQDTNPWVVQPPADENFVYMDPVSIEPYDKPLSGIGNEGISSEIDNTLGDTGQVSVLSVYNTDSLNVMNKGALTSSEIAELTALETADKRIFDGNDILLENLVELTAMNPDARPARFFRITKAVPTPDGSMNMVGINGFEMQQIVGYGIVEPDGSIKFNMEPDTSFGISVLDRKGRSIQTHLNWLQVRPSERLTCNGCHSPRRGTPLNQGGLYEVFKAANPSTVEVAADSVSKGTETMAVVRSHEGNDNIAGMGPTTLELTRDVNYLDIWTTDVNAIDSTEITLAYSDAFKEEVRTASGDAAVTALENGIINYTQHIQPIFDSKCVNCHKADDLGRPIAGNLILTSDPDVISGRYTSYEQLTNERIMFENGVPVEDNPDTEEAENLAPVLIGANGNEGISRHSYLAEVLFHEELKDEGFVLEATDDSGNVIDPGISFNHATMELVGGATLPAAIATETGTPLTASELRVMVEWMDIGAQYFNSHSLGQGLMGSTDNLDETLFASGDTTRGIPPINDILVQDCIECHQAGADGQSHSFVLTRDGVEGNFAIAANFVNGNDPLRSMLLTMPTQGEVEEGQTVQDQVSVHHATKQWDPSNTNFQFVRDWILNSLNN